MCCGAVVDNCETLHSETALSDDRPNGGLLCHLLHSHVLALLQVSTSIVYSYFMDNFEFCLLLLLCFWSQLQVRLGLCR